MKQFHFSKKEMIINNQDSALLPNSKGYSNSSNPFFFISKILIYILLVLSSLQSFGQDYDFEIKFEPHPPIAYDYDLSFTSTNPCLVVNRVCWKWTGSSCQPEAALPSNRLPFFLPASDWQTHGCDVHKFRITDTCLNLFTEDSFKVDNYWRETFERRISCDNYTWAKNGMNYNASGTYTHTSVASPGDTTKSILILTINNSSTSTASITACDSYFWTANGATYTASGTYTATSTNPAGCNNTATLILTINTNCNGVSVPTLSEWSLIILFLLSISLGMVFIYRKERTLSFANSKMRNHQMPLFELELFTKVLLAVMALFSIASFISYKITSSFSTTDLMGSLVASTIIAFMIQLFMLMKRFENKG